MRNTTLDTDRARRRWTVAMVILWLSLVFLCVVLAFGVDRVSMLWPDLTSVIWPEDAGRQPLAR